MFPYRLDYIIILLIQDRRHSWKHYYPVKDSASSRWSFQNITVLACLLIAFAISVKVFQQFTAFVLDFFKSKFPLQATELIEQLVNPVGCPLPVPAVITLSSSSAIASANRLIINFTTSISVESSTSSSDEYRQLCYRKSYLSLASHCFQ